MTFITIKLFFRALVIFDARVFLFIPASYIYARGVDEGINFTDER